MSKEHAYAYEAGYRDGSIHYKLAHCPACKNVTDLQEALEENAKLRKQGERLFDKALELGTENAKLRLLVRNLIRVTHPADRAELIANAVELGIEMDE